MLDQLRNDGVNAIALVPTDSAARRASDPFRRRIGRRGIDRGSHRANPPAWHKVMLKPRLWAHGSFPGDIHFDRAADRDEWFRNYHAFLEFYARLAAKSHADIFCVGVEFVPNVALRGRMAQAHRARSQRKLFSGPLVYAATQGPEFEGVRFRDALRLYRAEQLLPAARRSPADVDRKDPGWCGKFQEAGDFLRKPDFPVSIRGASVERSSRALSLTDQARCYEAVLRAFTNSPGFQVSTGGRLGTNGFGGPRDGSHRPGVSRP